MPRDEQIISYKSIYILSKLYNTVATKIKKKHFYLKFLDLSLAAGHPVQSNLDEATSLQLIDTVDQNSRYEGRLVGRVVGQPVQVVLAGRVLGASDADTGHRHVFFAPLMGYSLDKI